MSFDTSCISAWWLNIDWSATGNWISALATCAAAIAAWRALDAWHLQIKQQESYQKADLLICSYVRLVNAGFHMHFCRKNGDDIKPIDFSGKEYMDWVAALSQYRVDILLADVLIGEAKPEGYVLEAKNIESKINSISLDDFSKFLKDMDNIMNEGVIELKRLKTESFIPVKSSFWRKE